MLDKTIDDVAFAEENKEKRFIQVIEKSGDFYTLDNFDIYGVNAGVLVIGYSDGSFNHINLDAIQSFKYFITKE